MREKRLSRKSKNNIGIATKIAGRTINEKCPTHRGVDTVDADNDWGRIEWFQCIKRLVLALPISNPRGVVLTLFRFYMPDNTTLTLLSDSDGINITMLANYETHPPIAEFVFGINKGHCQPTNGFKGGFGSVELKFVIIRCRAIFDLSYRQVEMFSKSLSYFLTCSLFGMTPDN